MEQNHDFYCSTGEAEPFAPSSASVPAETTEATFSEGEHEANAVTPLRHEHLRWAALSPEDSQSDESGGPFSEAER